MYNDVVSNLEYHYSTDSDALAAICDKKPFKVIKQAAQIYELPLLVIIVIAFAHSAYFVANLSNIDDLAPSKLNIVECLRNPEKPGGCGTGQLIIQNKPEFIRDYFTTTYILFYSLFGKHYNDKTVKATFIVSHLIYFSPLWLLLFLSFFYPMPSTIQGIKDLRAAISQRNFAENDKVREILERYHCGKWTSYPEILICDNQPGIAEIKYIGFPFFKFLIKLDREVISIGTFSDRQIIALLIHEIQHQSLIAGSYTLSILSKLSLTGTAFLAVKTNYFKEEISADQAAISWLENNGGDRMEYIKLLEYEVGRKLEKHIKSENHENHGNYYIKMINLIYGYKAKSLLTPKPTLRINALLQNRIFCNIENNSQKKALE